MSREQDYINFSQEHELNYILKKYNKQQTEANRKQLIILGEKCKTSLNKTMLTHNEFYAFLNEKEEFLKSLS